MAEVDKSTKSLFDSAISIELIAGRMYRNYKQYFAHVPEIADFWADLGGDETKHAEILRETRDSLKDQELASECNSFMWETMTQLRGMMEKAVNRTVSNLDEAYELAHQIESSEIQALFKFLTLEFFSSPMREAFITSEIIDHQSKLLTFTERFGPKTWRKEILAVK